MKDDKEVPVSHVKPRNRRKLVLYGGLTIGVVCMLALSVWLLFGGGFMASAGWSAARTASQHDRPAKFVRAEKRIEQVTPAKASSTKQAQQTSQKQRAKQYAPTTTPIKESGATKSSVKRAVKKQ